MGCMAEINRLAAFLGQAKRLKSVNPKPGWRLKVIGLPLAQSAATASYRLAASLVEEIGLPLLQSQDGD